MAKALDWGMLEGSVGPRVRLLRNALAARSIAASAPHGLPTGSLTVLALLAANPGSSQTALAGRAGLNKSALVGIVDCLEQRDLVKRGRVENDRRRYAVSLTPAGERTMRALFAAVDREERDIRDALGQRDMIALLGLLDRAIAALDN
ncbi:MAG TPA: MarR family winged helix-turn-helix transcriptional regulator [Croceibacterium sp.]|nr:MarR family winged helix-turn-helix transcriptional regulator [Croceibacterium sp.]